MERADDQMISEQDKIKAALIEILNHPKNLGKFSEVFKSFDTLAGKTMAIEFKLFDTESKDSESDRENTISFSSTPLAPSLTQFGLTFCPYPRCSPPPGKFI